MPGTLVRDALAAQIFAGATLNAAGTTNGTAVQIDKPGEVEFELATGTVASTGNTATIQVEIFGADNSAMTTNPVSFGKFGYTSGTDLAQSNTKKYLRARVDKKFIRATVVLGGTAPVYTGSTLKPVPKDFLRVAQTTTA